MIDDYVELCKPELNAFRYTLENWKLPEKVLDRTGLPALMTEVKTRAMKVCEAKERGENNVRDDASINRDAVKTLARIAKHLDGDKLFMPTELHARSAMPLTYRQFVFRIKSEAFLNVCKSFNLIIERVTEYCPVRKKSAAFYKLKLIEVTKQVKQ